MYVHPMGLSRAFSSHRRVFAEEDFALPDDDLPMIHA